MSGCRCEAGRLFQILGTQDRGNPIAKLNVCSRNSENDERESSEAGGIQSQRSADSQSRCIVQ